MGLESANTRLDPYAAAMPARAAFALGMLRRASVHMPRQISIAAESQRIGPLHCISSDETASRPSSAAVAKSPCADAAPTPVARPCPKPCEMLRWTQTSDIGPKGRATDRPSVIPAMAGEVTSCSGRLGQGGGRSCVQPGLGLQVQAAAVVPLDASWTEPPISGADGMRFR